MDIRWLQDFLTLAETRNFTRAAALRNASQAAFSRRIQSLESWLGAPLLDRSIFPTRLTPAGEQFRAYASEILKQVVDARTELSGKPNARPEHIRIALPYTLATSRLPDWWADWTKGRRLSSSILLGNVHDIVTALVSGNVDIMICFHNAQQPIHLDPDRYERLRIETDMLRPYASKDLLARDKLSFPGRDNKPLPLLMYSSGVYAARLVDLILEAAPEKIVGVRVLESDMADVLRDMAVRGYGIAWLSESTVAASGSEELVPVGGPGWTLPLSTLAFRDRSNDKPSVRRLWATLSERAAASGLAGSA